MLTASLGENGAGVQLAVRRLADTLGNTVEVCVYGGASPQHVNCGRAGDWHDGPAYRPLRVAGPAAFGYLPDLPRSLETDRLDLLHTHGLWMYPSIASILWSRARRPYVVSPHGMLDPWALRNSAWKKKLAAYAYENRHLRAAACLHALNESEACSIRRYGLENPICVIPNGVDLPAETEPAGGKEKVCLYLGRLHPKKGIPALLRAWATLSPTNWKLVLAGWGQPAHEREFRDLACRLDLNGAVRFVGPKFGAEKVTCFGTASAFILPSFSEGLPMAVLEAWSYGLPVAMTPECNLPEGFATGAALRFEANEDAIAGALTALFAMKEAELREMGARGRRLVQQHFTWQHVTAQWLTVYQWILNGAPIPDCVRLN